MAPHGAKVDLLRGSSARLAASARTVNPLHQQTAPVWAGGQERPANGVFGGSSDHLLPECSN